MKVSLVILCLIFSIYPSSKLNATIIRATPAPLPIQVSAHSELVLTHLWMQVDPKALNEPLQDDTQAKNQNVSIVDQKLPEHTPSMPPSPSKTEAPAQAPSQGEQYVAMMKEKNRKAIKAKHEKQQNVEKLQDQSQKNFDMNKPIDLKKLYHQGLNQLKRKNQTTYSNWHKQQAETLKQWKHKQIEFYKNLSYYKENLIEFEASHQIYSSKKLQAPLSVILPQNFYVISNSLDLEIRDQGKRPTCSAFAGIRSLETLLYSTGKKFDLSEQYFYWLSKPNCQKNPCQNRGSWVLNAFKQNQKSNRFNIPSEADCPYTNTSIQGNETQIPLRQTCYAHAPVRVKEFNEVVSLNEVITALEKGEPVVAGFKLSPNFYTNKGLVSYKESLEESNSKMDSHAAGHALLIIGYMKLPSIQQSEGNVCFITANSWGEGWGVGGHACLTEKWVLHHRVPNAFVALKSVEI